jgi:hypothetical protein
MAGVIMEVPQVGGCRFHYEIRTKVTEGPGSTPAGLAMAFKLIWPARDRWRAVNAPRLLTPVRAGAAFAGGQPAEPAGHRHQPPAGAVA